MSSILVDKLENYYEFECPGGPLKNCIEWQYLRDRVIALEAALRSYREHPANHQFCLRGVNTHVHAGREYDNRCMQCVAADKALEGK